MVDFVEAVQILKDVLRRSRGAGDFYTVDGDSVVSEGRELLDLG